MVPHKTRVEENTNPIFQSATKGGWEKPKIWGDGTAGQPLGPPTRAGLRARGVENLLTADSLPTTRRNLGDPAPLPKESKEVTLRRAALNVEQVAIMTQQTIFDMQPPSSVRDEEDSESLPDSSISNSFSATEDYDEDVFDVTVVDHFPKLRAARERSTSEFLASNVFSAAETDKDETVNAIVAACLSKLRAGRAIVRQEALAVNRELGIDIRTVSMTTAKATLASTNRETSTTVTMEDS